MLPIDFPAELRTLVGSESVDFAVKARRIAPLRTQMAGMLFGLVFVIFPGSILWFALLGPILAGETVHFEANGAPASASLDNLGEAVLPMIVIAVFVLIGIGLFGYALSQALRPGSYFVGTPERLLEYRKGEVHSRKWSEFPGSVSIYGTAACGTLAFNLGTGHYQSAGKHGPRQFVPDKLYLVGIPDAFRIEGICRKRIGKPAYESSRE
ncbi:hypothetical protein FACS1894186_3010 [Alphaproteobacteria bacterium]|nr:hypothetical protein FACS1894186_3010 [Alphaproteobacteria bacterium]